MLGTECSMGTYLHILWQFCEGGSAVISPMIADGETEVQEER